MKANWGSVAIIVGLFALAMIILLFIARLI